MRGSIQPTQMPSRRPRAIDVVGAPAPKPAAIRFLLVHQKLHRPFDMGRIFFAISQGQEADGGRHISCWRVNKAPWSASDFVQIVVGIVDIKRRKSPLRDCMPNPVCRAHYRIRNVADRPGTSPNPAAVSSTSMRVLVLKRPTPTLSAAHCRASRLARRELLTSQSSPAKVSGSL